MTPHARHSGDIPPREPAHAPCGECPLAVDRRAFLRSAAMAVAGALAAGTLAPAAAAAVGTLQPNGAGRERVYAIPAHDGVSIDESNEVIIVRWQNRGYAFSSRCTHRGAPLEWRDDERKVFCPKHKARFRPDGTHATGRRARDLDRFDVQRRGDSLVVDLDALRRADEDPAAWAAAVVSLG